MASMPELAAQHSLVAVAAGRTDVGRRRDHNEDQILVNHELQLFAVADGMGGHQAGDVASSIAAASLEEFFWDERAPQDDLDPSLPEGARRLVSAVHHCNREVFARSGRSANQGGMGSTVVAIHVDDTEGLLHIAHVGDSRCYRIRDEKIELLTLDHSMINEALRLNPDLSPEILRQLPSNVVTRALGTKEDVQPDVRSEPLVEGDIYLLCSDGLSGEVSDEDLLFGVLESEHLADACELLVAMANEAGGRDNISALLVRVVDGTRDDYSHDPDTPRVILDKPPRPRDQLVTERAGPDRSAGDDDDDEDVYIDDDSFDDDLPEPGENDEELDEVDEAVDEEEIDEEIDDAAGDSDDELAEPPDEDFDESHERDLPQPSALGLSALEPPFGSVATLGDYSLSLEPPSLPGSDHPYAEVAYEAIEASGDPSRAPAFAVVGVGEMQPEPSLEPPPKLCGACGHELLPEERFCGMCGARTDVEDDPDVARCDACGHEVYLGTRYCVECGVRHGY